ncbi:MAG: NAD(P)H-hydrate dehydratase, partial [Deltaproteobacteria bacterium]
MLTGEEMRLCDRSAIERFGVPGVALMETAGRAVADAALEALRAGDGRRVALFCGPGNNGGDGYVAARYLRAAGCEVEVLLTGPPERVTGDAKVFLEVLRRMEVELTVAAETVPVVDLRAGDVVVDALLGTGLSRPVEGPVRALIDYANELGRRGVTVVAVDLPSGLSADTGQVLGAAVRADRTVTFGYPKRGLLLHPGAALAGRWEVVDIGLPPQVEEVLGPPCELLTPEGVAGLRPRRPPDAHKGTVGHVLVVAGSKDRPGAAALTCLGALRGGAGLVTLAARPDAHASRVAWVPEAMGLDLPGEGPLGEADLEALLAAAEGKDAVAFGPGIPRGEGTAGLVAALLMELDVPVVLDADGINAVAGQADLLKGAAVDLVLTPHPGEMARLAGRSVQEIQMDRLGVASDFARRHDAYVVLKGARTVVADPDGALAINPTGNAGMATAGSGDVLTGLIAALLAQGLPPGAAARVGVYAHGLAGDKRVEATGAAGLIARD